MMELSCVRRILACGLACLLLTTAAPADGDIAVGVEMADELRASSLRTDAEGALQLTLEDAIRVALERNLALVAERYEYRRSLFGVMQEQGIFDLNVNLDLAIAKEVSPTVSNLEDTEVEEENTQRGNLTVSRLNAWGGTASFTWSNFYRDTNSSLSSFNPAYTLGMDLTYNQPLLRDFGRDVTRYQLIVAQNSAEISREVFSQQVINTVQQVENAYWNLVEAISQLQVVQESYTLAKELHERNRIRVEVGTLAPFELTQSEAGIAEREGDIINQQAVVGDAEDELRRLLNLESGALWQSPIVPSTEANPDTELTIDLDEAITTALENRSELTGKQLEIRNAELDSAFSRNQRLPQVDLSVTYGYNGLGGTVIERESFFGGPITRIIPGDYGDALTQVADRDFEGWRVGLVVGMPLQNRAARARSARADLALERTQVELGDLEQQVVNEVRQGVRRLESAAKQIVAARASLRAQENALEAERKRFENGMSTSFQVLQIQEDLTQAASREAQAVTNYRVQQAAYLRSIGQLLDANNIQIREPAGP